MTGTMEAAVETAAPAAEMGTAAEEGGAKWLARRWQQGGQGSKTHGVDGIMSCTTVTNRVGNHEALAGTTTRVVR